MRIVITGSVGTGKSSIADALGKMLGISVIHLSEFVRKHRLLEGDEVDIEKLRSLLLRELPPRWIIEGHLACEFSLPADVVVVLRSSKDVLEQRLKNRGYDEKKIHENVMAELLDYCYIKAEENYRCPILQVDTSSGNFWENARKVLKYIKKGKSDIVDHSSSLKEAIKDDLRFM